MIEVLESAKHLVALKISDSVTAEDVSKAYAATQSALDSNERISFFAEIEPSMGLTLKGLYKDLSEGLKHFGSLSKYYRAAVVTDKGWLGAMARVEGLVFSSIDVRVFSPAERDKAFAWASEAPEPLPKPVEPERTVHFLQTTSENVFAYEVNGRLREKDIKAAVAEMKPYLERDGKFNVLARIKDLGGFDLMALFDDDLIKMKYSALGKVEKYAVVGGKPWLRNLVELMAPLFATQVRVFDPDEEAAAWEWVGAQQALLPE